MHEHPSRPRQVRHKCRPLLKADCSRSRKLLHRRRAVRAQDMRSLLQGERIPKSAARGKAARGQNVPAVHSKRA